MSSYLKLERIKRLAGYVIGSAQFNIHWLLQREVPSPQSQASLRSEDGYYSLIAAEVSKLPNNTHLARQALYDRVWVATVAQLLHGQEPAVSEVQVASERIAFQRALCKVEVEMAMHMGGCAGEVPA